MIETPAGWAVLFLLGCFTGTLSGLLGIGGGLLMVPALTLFGVPLIQATATSLIGVFLSAVSGSLRNLHTGELNWRVSLILAIFGMITAQVGAWLGDRVPDAALSLGFATLLVVTIFLMNLRQRLKRQQERQGLAAATPIPEAIAPRPEPSPQPAEPERPTYQFAPIAGIGLLAGVLSGLFGVGGGVVMVPLQMLLLKEAIKTAVRTSLGAIVAIAISGLVQHTWNGNVLWVPGFCLGAGGIIGAQFGTRLLPKLSDQLVSALFKLLLLALAIYMVVRTLV
jgi:hypothetical protein